MIIGDPVFHSLSPQMQNTAFKNLKIDNKFVFLGAKVSGKDLKNAMSGIRALGILGVTVTHPHKQSVIKYLDVVDPIAKKIGAVNTILNDNGKLIGSNTDYIGVYKSLEQKTNIKGKSVAIIGAGGAARAAVFAITLKGGKAIIFNRTVEKAKKLAEEFKCGFAPMEDIKKAQNMDIIINLTPVSSYKNLSPVEKKYLNSNQIVFDAVYFPFETKLLREAKEKGATIIQGTEWLLHQGIEQFEIYTKMKAPVEVMRKSILDAMKGKL